MELYFVLNILISLAAAFAMSSPYFSFRKKLYFGICSLCCWFLPIHWLSLMRPSNLFLPGISELIPALFSPKLNYIKFLDISLYAWLIIVPITFGLIKFASDYLMHFKQIKIFTHMKTVSSIENINGKEVEIIKTKAINGAMTSGIFNPVIWVSENIENDAEYQAVVLHESTHIKNNDPLLLLILHLIECLMWWNPIALLVVTQCKQHIELSCDEICKQKLGLTTYKLHLAKLVLTLNETEPTPTMVGMRAMSNNFNIIRIKKLSTKQKISWFDYLRYTVLSITIFTLILLFIRSGQTGLDSIRANKFEANSDTTWNIQIEQMPLRSLGIISIRAGITDSYIHKDVLMNFYYINLNDVSFSDITNWITKNTEATARIIDNKLYIMPDLLANMNDLSWTSDPKTTHFNANIIKSTSR